MNAHKFVAEYGIEEAQRVLEGAPKESTHFNNLDDEEYDCYVIIKQEWSEKNKHAYYQKDVLSNTFRWDFMPNNFAGYDLLVDAIGLAELKQVVESIEVVQQSGGFEAVKSAISNYRASGDMITFSSIEGRLADYELVEYYKGAIHE